MWAFFRILGIATCLSGTVAGILSFLFLKNQTLLLTLLARMVDRPFQLREYLSILSGVVFLVAGFFWGALFIGISEILRSLGRSRES